MTCRVCVVALDDPWKSNHGGTARTRLLVEALSAAGHETSIVYVGDMNSPAAKLAGVESRNIARKPTGERRWARPLRPLKRALLPLPTMRGGMIGPIGEAVASLGPDVLVVSQLRAAPYHRFVPDSALWLDQADVWSSFVRREISIRTGIPQATAALQLRHFRRLEKMWGAKAAVLSAAGFGDAEYLSALTKRAVEWLPTAAAARTVERRTDGHRTAGFLGNFAFWPNRDAYDLLRTSWAPALSRIGWRVVVAGLESTTLERSADIEILGPVENLADYYTQIDVSLAPIRLGAGVKVKVIEALMLKRPVVASAWALDGFPPDLRAAIPVVSERSPDFAFLASAGCDLTDAFELAGHYFSMSTWNASVIRLAEQASQGPASG